MTIKQHGGVFGRNPKFNSVEAESLSIAGNAVPDASTILVDGDIGSTVQGYDADTAKYDDATANFTGTLQNGGSNVLVDTDIGSTVQGYDAATAKTDESNVFTTAQKLSSAAPQLRFIETDQTDVNTKIGNVGGKFRIETMDDAETSFTARFLVDNTTGNAEITDGNLVISTSGKGIDFSATGDGSGTTDSELFDDYEYGTFDPTIGGVDVGVGHYTKIGRLVFIEMVITANSVSTDTIDGLPFSLTSANGYGGLTFGVISRADVSDANGVPCRINFSAGTSIEFSDNAVSAASSNFTITTTASNNVRLGISGVGRVF